MVDARQFLYRIQPARTDMLVTGPTPDEAQTVSEHFDYLEQLTERGVVILAGRTLTTDSRSFGIIVFNAADETEAQAIMHNDPAVQRGVFRADLFPYRVALIREANVHS